MTTHLLALQNIPPRWAHFCLNVEKFFLDELAVMIKGQSVVVGLSGGADSSALLVVLTLLKPRLGLQLFPAHLDHAIRKESNSDREHAQALCGRLGLPLDYERRDIPAEAADQSLGLEEAGRQARYAFFEHLRQKHKADWIALGHQLDDLAEDQLLRLVRGAGWPALGGMSAVCPDRKLIRPLLLSSRKDLEALLTDLGIRWVTDVSNEDTHYRRNRMRHQMLPLLVAENPGYLDNAAGLWRLAQLDQDYWNSWIEKTLSTQTASLSNKKNFTLPDAMLRNCHRALRLRIYKAFLDSIGSGQVNQQTLFLLDEAWHENRVGKQFQFPGAKTVDVTKQGLFFQAKVFENPSK